MKNWRILFRFIIFFKAVKRANCEAEEINGNYDDFDIELDSSKQMEDSTFQTPDKEWITKALVDIAYYLRNHKFNEWDRRYYKEKPENNVIGFHYEFPMPPLRALHWKVSENCNTNFYKCIIYLHSFVKIAPLTKDDDTVTVVIKRHIPMNETLFNQLNSECQEALSYSEKSGSPFGGPIERFQWRTTASYYMCWYTMLEQPELSMLGEPCDNHANCLDPEFGPHNKDPRSDDRLFFACATYSFCPDICCPVKHLKSYNECYDDDINPCYAETSKKDLVEKPCLAHWNENRNFKDIVNNRWNVTCSCENVGFIWKSEFGMCVDINECVTGAHTCDKESEDCLNLPGTFMCICKWGFKYEDKQKRCCQNELFNILISTTDTN